MLEASAPSQLPAASCQLPLLQAGPRGGMRGRPHCGHHPRTMRPPPRPHTPRPSRLPSQEWLKKIPSASNLAALANASNAGGGAMDPPTTSGNGTPTTHAPEMGIPRVPSLDILRQLVMSGSTLPASTMPPAMPKLEPGVPAIKGEGGARPPAARLPDARLCSPMQRGRRACCWPPGPLCPLALPVASLAAHPQAPQPWATCRPWRRCRWAGAWRQRWQRRPPPPPMRCSTPQPSTWARRCATSRRCGRPPGPCPAAAAACRASAAPWRRCAGVAGSWGTGDPPPPLLQPKQASAAAEACSCPRLSPACSLALLSPAHCRLAPAWDLLCSSPPRPPLRAARGACQPPVTTTTTNWTPPG